MIKIETKKGNYYLGKGFNMISPNIVTDDITKLKGAVIECLTPLVKVGEFYYPVTKYETFAGKEIDCLYNIYAKVGVFESIEEFIENEETP